MAEKTKSVKKKYVTGKGILTGFIAIQKPSQQFDNYTANILLSKAEGEKLVKELKELQKEQFALSGKKGKLAELPCKPYMIQDEETGEELPDTLCRYIFKAGGKAHNDSGELILQPQLINAKCQPIKGELNIGEGTVARLQVMLKGYKAPMGIGVSAKLLGCQIIDLVQYASGFSAEDFDEEEGFDGTGTEFREETKVVAEDSDEEEEPDF